MTDEQKQTKEQTQLVPTTNGTAIEMFDERDVVYELASRLMTLHPDANKLGKATMVAAAQLALRQGINPLPGGGELHIFESKGQPRLYVALQFYQRKAREVAGGILWDIEPRPMTQEERIQWDIPEQDIASICRGARRDDILSLGQAGYTPEQTWRMCARTGVGTASPGERSAKKAARPLTWTTNKRSEVDCYRHLIPTLEQPGKLHIEEVDAWTRIAVPPPEGHAIVRPLTSTDDDIIIDEQTGEVVFGPDPDPDGELAERIAEIKARNGAEQHQDALPGMEE